MFFNFSVPLKKGHIHIKVGDKTMKQKQRGRPPMCRGTKQRKKDFDYKLKCYSTQALDNVIHLAESAFSAETKLKANIFLIEKAVGKNYSALEQYKGDAQENELNINLQIIEPEHNINTGQVETEIKEAENNLEDDEGWGDNLYTP